MHCEQALDRGSEPDMLQQLLWLFRSTANVPSNLYPGGARVTRITWLRQIAYGYAKFVSLITRGARVAIIHGENLTYSTGWVDFSLRPRGSVFLRALTRVRPIIPISRDSASSIWTVLGIDRAEALELLFSHNGYILVRGTREGVPCIIHYASSPSGRAAIGRHATGLAAANEHLRPVLGNIVPQLEEQRSLDRGEIVIQREMEGVAASCKAKTEVQVAALIKAGMEPLHSIYRSTQANRRRFESSFIRTELSRLLTTLPTYSDTLAPVIERLVRWVDAGDLESIPTHGDYAPRNLFFSPDYARVTGIVDWEWFWADGVAGFDALKYLLEIEAERAGKSLFAGIADFLERDDKALAQSMQPVLEMYGLSADDLRHMALLIWLRVLWMGCVITEPASEAWLRDAVNIPARALRRRNEKPNSGVRID